MYNDHRIDRGRHSEPGRSPPLRNQKRLTELIALGVIGYGVALIFAVYSTPDLAITQILVETLTVALFAWVVYKLPALRKLSQTSTMLFDAVVIIAAGFW